MKDIRTMTNAELDHEAAELAASSRVLDGAWPILDKHGYHGAAQAADRLARSLSERYNKLDEERERRRP